MFLLLSFLAGWALRLLDRRCDAGRKVVCLVQTWMLPGLLIPCSRCFFFRREIPKMPPSAGKPNLRLPFTASFVPADANKEQGVNCVSILMRPQNNDHER